jgi:hypothetical protein
MLLVNCCSCWCVHPSITSIYSCILWYWHLTHTCLLVTLSVSAADEYYSVCVWCVWCAASFWIKKKPCTSLSCHVHPNQLQAAREKDLGFPWRRIRTGSRPSHP